MSIVRMDIDVAEQTIRQFGSAFEELQQALQPLISSVEQLGQGWEGVAAQNFLTAWQGWTSDLTRRINDLQPLQQGLMTERQQMIDADSSASFSA